MREGVLVPRAVALYGGALVLASLTSLHLFLNWRLYGDTTPYATVWIAEAVEWCAWATFVPVIWEVERRHGTATGRMFRAAAIHAALLVGFYAILNALMVGTGIVLGTASVPEGGLTRLFLVRAVNAAPSAVLIYSLIVAAAVLARVSARHSRQRAALEAQLSEARLRYLRAQIQPHFLFNALHGIAGLIREGDRDRAVQIIGLLGRLLRRALAADEQAEVELGEELADLETYVEIQRMRFGERVRFTKDVPASLESVEVPALMLQPLVENAIRHGLGPDGGHVHVSAVRDNGVVVLEVSDDGVGLPPAYREGVGIGNLRARLEAIYGPAAALEIREARPDGSGVTVRIRLPGEPDRGAHD